MSLSFPKPVRQVNLDYLDYIKSHKCIVSNAHGGPTHPHHLTRVGAGGSDYGAIPLCAECHDLAHTTGDRTFGDKYGIDFWYEAWRLVVIWLDLKGDPEWRNKL
jgi:hypothetical protein